MSGSGSRPRFGPADPVRVRTGPAAGHVRTPWYIQGKRGRIAAVHGAYRNPESLAYGGDGLPKQFLYLVRFEDGEVWATGAPASRDALLVDVYEHWLEPA